MALTWLWILLGAVALLTMLYLLMIMPRITRRRDFSIFKTRMFAHRGLHDNEGDAPENSLKAFEAAVSHGYGIELDIQLSRDGVPVVFHDFTLTRNCGLDKRVKDLSVEELKQLRLFHSRETIPTLKEVLALVDGRVPLLIEFKMEFISAALCRAAMALLDHYKGIFCIESFNPITLLWFQHNRPGIIRGQLSSDYRGEKKGFLGYLHTHMVFNFLTKPDFIAYRFQNAGLWSFQLCRRFYKTVCFGWTVRSEEELKLARKHFDYIIFDSFIPKEAQTDL